MDKANNIRTLIKINDSVQRLKREAEKEYNKVYAFKGNANRVYLEGLISDLREVQEGLRKATISTNCLIF